jgi:phosphate transport system permease protein
MRWIERVLDSFVYTTGIAIALMVVAIFYFLMREGRFAFQQTFPWGYRFALLPAGAADADDVNAAPFSTLITANPEGADEIDEREENYPAPSIAELTETQPLATAALVQVDQSRVALFRDEWRAPKPAEHRETYRFVAYASPNYRHDTFYLAWLPDNSFEASLTPYRIRLRLVQAPPQSGVQPFNIDLKQSPSGRIPLPTYVARTDAERRQGYVFEIIAEPTTSTFWATLRNLFRKEWAPTLMYPRYGVLPLVVSTALMTLLAMLLAAPLALAIALYLSEVASARMREWLKPTLELIASVPTVVIGYFGLMFVAPYLQQSLGAWLSMESGRNMLTTALLLSVLALPVVASITEDVLNAVPESLRESAVALGLTTVEYIRSVLLPAAKSGIIASLLIGTARVYGETMIVWILSGGTAAFPQADSLPGFLKTLVSSTRGVPDTIAIEMGNVAFEGVHYGHLFLLGIILFVATLAANLLAVYIGRKQIWRF